MTMRAHDRAWAALALAVLVTLGACGSGDGAGDGSVPSASSPTSPSPSPPAGDPGSSAPTDPQQEEAMDLELRIGDDTFTAELDDSAAARDLVAQLPVTLEMRDHGSVEKTGALPSPLSLEGQPDGADPDVGDLGYYAPGHDLVLYYGDQSYFAGIVVLGRLGDGVAAAVAAMDGTVTVTVTTAG
ncbi:cyclophilin-like fold protein [Aeromicrobium massiliense]|uniref:cyclophilin-like fold protein n=1 Tax=Aeromicrobium massiliense TaxID=1464554 RepID=UPI0003074278|nr:cyclophilin-like fold protein [Aeromicrobium massiliense]